MQSNIISTLSYAGVFNFPLTLKELRQRLIGKITSITELKKQISSLGIKSYRGFYFLGNKGHVDKRIKNKIYLKRKLNTAHKIAKLLKIFPTIQAVLVTGAVAAKNPQKDDDIDFLIITSQNSLWITRLLVNIFLNTLCLRRTPSTKNPSNKACLNLWLSTNTLALPKSRQNLYSAYEVSLCIPLWERNNVYKRFIFQNKWITHFLPNKAIPQGPFISEKKIGLSTLDLWAYKLQLRYMKSKRTRETITRGTAYFHPRNTRKSIETKHKKLYNKYSKVYLS